MTTAHDALRQLTRRQHGLASRAQLAGVGLTSHGVRRALATGRLERISEAFGAGGAADTPEQRAMAAAPHVPHSAVAMHSAAALWRMPGFELEPVHVLATRRPHRDRDRVGRMHSSVRLRDEDITAIHGIPVTTPLRTIRDLAGRIHPERLSQACDRMISQRLIRLPDLHALIDELPLRGGAPGTGALRHLILARPDGYRPADSNLELRFESILEEAGEVPFVRQVEVGDDEGRHRAGRLPRPGPRGDRRGPERPLPQRPPRRRTRRGTPRPTPSCRLDRPRGHRRGGLAPQGRGRGSGAIGPISRPTSQGGSPRVGFRHLVSHLASPVKAARLVSDSDIS